jgi:hypothetical protein
MKTIGRDFGDTARKVYAVASGALGNGKACVVNTDGTVSVISGASQATGTAVEFENAQTADPAAAFDSVNNKILLVYEDSADSNAGTAIVGTISGTSISFGSPSVWDVGVDFPHVAFDTNTNKFLIAYKDLSEQKGKAIVATVSGTSVSFGTASIFNAANTQQIGIAFDSNANKFAIAFRDSGNSNYGTGIVATISGTSVSFGSETVFKSASTLYNSTLFDSSANKIVIAYNSNSNNTGGCVVGTISGTSISFGSEVVFNNAETDRVAAAYDSSNNKTVIMYRDAGDSYDLTAIVGTVSGTSISFGSEVKVEATGNADFSSTSLAFDNSANKFLFIWQDGGNSDRLTLAVGTVSGTSISFGSKIVPDNSYTFYGGNVVFDSNLNKFLVSFVNGGDSSHGYSLVFQNDSSNLTSENFIGFTPSAYPTGAGAEIQTQGAINEEQSGLTAGQSYYVQTDGTLGTTAASPSVFAGTAVSATKIIVKG